MSLSKLSSWVYLPLWVQLYKIVKSFELWVWLWFSIIPVLGLLTYWILLAVVQPAITYLIRRLTHCFHIPSVRSRGYYPGQLCDFYLLKMFAITLPLNTVTNSQNLSWHHSFILVWIPPRFWSVFSKNAIKSFIIWISASCCRSFSFFVGGPLWPNNSILAWSPLLLLFIFFPSTHTSYVLEA